MIMCWDDGWYRWWSRCNNLMMMFLCCWFSSTIRKTIIKIFPKTNTNVYGGPRGIKLHNLGKVPKIHDFDAKWLKQPGMGPLKPPDRDLQKVYISYFSYFGPASRPAWPTNARNVVYSSLLMCSCTGSSLSSVWAPRQIDFGVFPLLIKVRLKDFP